jgi:hypothetical protein
MFYYSSNYTPEIDFVERTVPKSVYFVCILGVHYEVPFKLYGDIMAPPRYYITGSADANKSTLCDI